LTIYHNPKRDDTAGSSFASVHEFARMSRRHFHTKTELTEMRLSRSRICAIAILALFVGVGGGCALIGKVRAKNELNEAAKAYKDGHFEDAEQHARKALAFDPTNKTATIFVARIVHPTIQTGRGVALTTFKKLAMPSRLTNGYCKSIRRAKKPFRQSRIFTPQLRTITTSGSGFRLARTMRTKPTKTR
jgi:hypothetical protein